LGTIRKSLNALSCASNQNVKVDGILQGHRAEVNDVMKLSQLRVSLNGIGRDSLLHKGQTTSHSIVAEQDSLNHVALADPYHARSDRIVLYDYSRRHMYLVSSANFVGVDTGYNQIYRFEGARILLNLPSGVLK
jgi:hypothetical protein